jgi:hypothetical protein
LWRYHDANFESTTERFSHGVAANAISSRPASDRAKGGDIMGRVMAFIVVVVCTAQVVLLRAQEPAHDPADARYAYHDIDGGYLRLDLRTGEVSTCRQRDGGWICTLAAEERAALESEIARLQRDNALLKNALLEHGLPLPSARTGAPTPAPAAPPEADASPQSNPPVTSAIPPVASVTPQANPPAEAAPPRPPAPIPSDPDARPRERAEIDRVIDVMERLWHRLVELAAMIQRDIQK